MGNLIPLTEDGVDEVLDLPLAIVYKHSPSCGASRWAMTEMQRLADERPDAPIYVVDVIRQKPLSLRLADLLHVAHESPQAMLLENGSVTWFGAHSNVCADFLEEQLDIRATTRPRAEPA